MNKKKTEKSLPIESRTISRKMTLANGYFQMKKFLILMVFIIVKMIGYGHPVVLMLMLPPGGIKKKRKFPIKVMVWLGACSAELTPLVILDKTSVNHEVYIKEVLPVALKFGNKMLGDNWIYQQDGATSHTHQLTQAWCARHLPSFIPKDRCPANSLDLNPLDYCIWNELVEAMD